MQWFHQAAGLRAQTGPEQTQEHRDAGKLRSRSNQRRRGRWRTLVDIRRPKMKRSRRRLEAKCDQYHDEGHFQQRSRCARSERFTHQVQLDGSRQAIQ